MPRLSGSGGTSRRRAEGDYTDRRGSQQGFVAVERNGRWGTAMRVPGLAALNKLGYADVVSVSCASAGNCAAGGYYANLDEDGHDNDGFVVSQQNGVWRKAVTLPAKEDGDVTAVSCASAGNCLAGGDASDIYFDPFQGFVAQERNGRWGKATGVPGLAALNKGGAAGVNSVSCTPAGSCVAGGYYTDNDGNSQGFVAVERNGHWVTATGLPGLAALGKGGRPTAVLSVSCARAGSCAAAGYYTDRSGHHQGFVTQAR